MNKKLLLGMFATAGVLFATSCSHEALIEPVSGETSTVSFVVNTEDAVATRAVADGKTATKLHYAVWHSSGSIAKEDVVELQNRSTTLNLTLAKGQTYTLGFWAQAENAHTVTIAENGVMTVDVNYGPNNAETFDAFTAHKTYTVAGNDIQNVTLKRPFAQINVGVTAENYTAAEAAGVKVEKSKVELQGTFGTKFNVISGAVTDTQNGLVLAENNIPALTEDLTLANGNVYKYISTSYVLPEAVDASQLVDAKFTFKGENGSEIVLEDGVSNLPIKSNYRTNIIGNVLTGNVDFDVVVDADFDGENNTALWDGSSVSAPSQDAAGVYHINTAEDFAWIMNQRGVNSLLLGKTVVLDTDIDFAGQTIAGVGDGNCNFAGTFDGNGHTISNFVVDHSSQPHYAGLFCQVSSGAVIKNLTVKGATVIGNKQVGVIASSLDAASIENCHVENSVVIAKVKKAGAITGYTSNSTVKNCSAKNVEVYCADPAVAESDKIVGYVNTGSTVADNTADNVNVHRGAVIVSSAAEFTALGSYNGTINGVVTNKNIVLTKDIDLAGVALTPLRLDNSVFDGNGHKLTNVTAGEYGGRKSIFNGELPGGTTSTVKNLTIDGVTVDGGSFAGVLFGDVQNNGTIVIDGVHIKNAVVKNAETVGAFIGLISSAGTHDVTIKNSSVENAQIIGIEEVKKIGAIVGRAQVNWTLTNVVAKNVELYNNSTALGDVRVQGTKSAGTCNGTLTVQ